MSALPQPSRPITSLPTNATPKSKKSLAAPTEIPKTPSSSQLMSKLRTPSTASRPPPMLTTTPSQSEGSSSSLPTLRSTSSAVKQQPTPSLRRTISIASFPQPPKSPRPSISSSSGIPATLSSNSLRNSNNSARESNSGIATPGSIKGKKQSRLSTSTVASSRTSLTPSLLTSGPETRSLSIDAKTLPSIPSPSHSRSSSAQGSAASTSATTFEDVDDAGRNGSDTGDSAKIAQRNGQDLGKDGKGNVTVSVRVRPDAGGNDANRTEGEWMVDGRRSLVSYRGREGGDYIYDNVFATHDNNSKVYDASAKRLVRQVMEGYHGTVFAYGMTGTGKTFSMQGTATSPGVIPLAITDIFSYIRETPHREFLLRVSYLEIYNERIHDLLSASVSGAPAPNAPPQEEIKLREDSKRGVYATPLKEEIVQSPTQLLRVIARGDQARRVGSTQFNARSSRSHAVVQIVVESRERSAGGPMSENKRSGLVPGGVRVSTLSLIDLAGSERAAENKERRTEGAHINKSLLTLGTVISRLADKDKAGADKDGKHLPYRDSKLTRLLQPALSGNSLVSILCTIQLGPGSGATTNHIGETINTLKFAARAKNNIVSHAKRADEAIGTGGDAGSRALLDRYRIEIQTLREQLEHRNKEQNEVDEEDKIYEKEAEIRREEQMLEMQLARTALKERIEHLNRLILSSQSIGVNSGGSVSALGIYTHHRLSGATDLGIGTRSLRSSASQSTLGISNNFHRTASMTSLPSGRTSTGTSIISPRPSFVRNPSDEDDSNGEFGDGLASLQTQNKSLQTDLADKTRYIATLEKRLLHARRSSHSRASAGFAKSPTTLTAEEGSDLLTLLKEKDNEIEELKSKLEERNRMIETLRAAPRQQDLANPNPAGSAPEDNSQNRRGSVSTAAEHQSHSPVSPLLLLSPSKNASANNSPEQKKKRKSIDEMSKMLDEMIQDRVESGQLLKSSRGTVRVPHAEPTPASLRRGSATSATSSAVGGSTAESVIELPDVGTLVASIRSQDPNPDSVATK